MVFLVQRCLDMPIITVINILQHNLLSSIVNFRSMSRPRVKCVMQFHFTALLHQLHDSLAPTGPLVPPLWFSCRVVLLVRGLIQCSCSAVAEERSCWWCWCLCCCGHFNAESCACNLKWCLAVAVAHLLRQSKWNVPQRSCVVCVGCDAKIALMQLHFFSSIFFFFCFTLRQFFPSKWRTINVPGKCQMLCTTSVYFTTANTHTHAHTTCCTLCCVSVCVCVF